MRRLQTTLGVALILSAGLCYGQLQPLSCPGVSGIKDGLNTIVAQSPDGHLIACLIDYKETDSHTYTGAYLVRNGTPRLLKTYLDAGPSGPVAWSPDSRMFAVTLTSGRPGGIRSIDIFNVSTGAWKVLGSDAGRSLLQMYECNSQKGKDLISMQWVQWTSADDAVIEVSIDPIAALCRREGIMDPVKFRVKVPTGVVVNREP